jgi:integrase
MVQFEKWRIERKNDGTKPGTINKRISSLHVAFRWGVEHGFIKDNPLERIKRLPERNNPKVRYLSPDERERLMKALDDREERIRADRVSHNAWLAERGRATLPALEGEYADYLKPIVLLSLNMGIRQDNMFTLLWGDVDLATKIVTIRAEEAKGGRMLRLPINRVAFNVLTAWKDQSEKTGPADLVFPSPKTGGKLDNCDSSWMKLLREAQIEKFRWHDMRHDFASQLAMKGVPLMTIKELMGHADIKTTLVYAHLSPNVKQDAVELLDEVAGNGTTRRVSA